jgi:YjbE family integral membrane protein
MVATILTIGGIILVDLLLSGDNAILIALASRNLPKQKQAKAIIWGTAGAIALRIVLAFAAAFLVTLPGLRATGGLLLLWIAVRLLADNGNPHNEVAAASTLKKAIRTIIIADGIMSLDNVLAVVGLAGGNLLLIVFGIAVSIPFVMLSSGWLLKMIERYSVVIWIGGAVLIYAAAGMISGDLLLAPFLTTIRVPLNVALTAIMLTACYWAQRKS